MDRDSIQIERTLTLDDTKRLLTELDTGDVLLFSGNGFFSGLVKMATHSRWSHVAVVVRHQSLPGVPLIWQSVSGEMADVRGFTKNGVIITDLIRTVEKYYSGYIGLRKLEQPLNDEQLQVLNETFRELDGRPYESGMSGLWELFKSASDSGWTSPNHEALDHIFCSELIAEVFMRLGFIKKTPTEPSSEYTPLDFSQLQFCEQCGNRFRDLILIPLRNKNIE